MPNESIALDSIWDALGLDEEYKKQLAIKVIKKLEEVVDEGEKGESRMAATTLSEIVGLKRRDNKLNVSRPIVVTLPNYEESDGV